MYTGFLVSHVLTAASYFAPSHAEMFAPSHRVLEHSQQRPLDVDLWCEFRWRDGKPPTTQPAWELPSPAQVLPALHPGSMPSVSLGCRAAWRQG